jgi:hypothetical protein
MQIKAESSINLEKTFKNHSHFFKKYMQLHDNYQNHIIHRRIENCG